MLDNLTLFLYKIAILATQKANPPEKDLMEKLWDKFVSTLINVFQTITKLANNFIEQVDKLPIKDGLKWLIIAFLVSVVLLALSSALSSLFKASSEFLKNVTHWLRRIVKYGGGAAFLLIFIYWIFFSQRSCFEPAINVDKNWTACKTPKSSSKKTETK